MVKLIGFGILGALILSVSSCSFDRVSQGHVGVKVNNLGSEAGVQSKPLGVGWYFTPPGSTIYEYPVFTNNYTWRGDETFRFQDKSGLSVSADVSVAYRANPSKVPTLFQKYRVDMDGIVSGALRNAIRNAIVSNASTMSVEEIYGSKKSYLIEKARLDAMKYVEPFGIVIEQLTWAGNIDLPDSIQKQISDRVANEQEALAEEAKVATAKARSDAKIAEAQGKAEALRIEGEALSKNSNVAELRAIEKWDGKLPNTMLPNSSVPFLGNVTK